MKLLKTKSVRAVALPFCSSRTLSRSTPLSSSAISLKTEWIRKPHRVGKTARLISMNCASPTEKATETMETDTQSSSRVIVVAVDETEESVKALQWTIDNFLKTGDAIHLLHVIPYVHQQVLTSTVYYTPPILDPEVSQQLYENAEDVVSEKFIPVLEENKVKFVVDMVQEKGSETIGDAVCHAASDLNACVVVVAAHKKHWLQTWLMGSSSREIAGNAPIPVIVYHG